MKLIKVLVLVCALVFLVQARQAYASENQCENRFLTLVNPVRGRERWFDKSLDPIINQHTLVSDSGFSATWLFQYDALIDDELINEVGSWDDNQEIGLFLEVSPGLARDSRVIYPHAVAWDDPNAIFLSGYSQSDREKLIDTLVAKYQKRFSKYPRSVGAWWIDSYSLNYLVEEYGVNAALIVADQLTTDDYGVWGQWWGVPYYPSKANVLTPASELANKQDVVVAQWAQRDLSKAYGRGPKYSNYSLQANDYTERGETTQYFAKLANTYLDCELGLGQITVGLETGIESVRNLEEYSRQLEFLGTLDNIHSVSMEKFSQKYSEAYPDLSANLLLSDDKTEWVLEKDKRENKGLSDYIIYNPDVSFSDYFIADKSTFLDRRLPEKDERSVNDNYEPWFLAILIVSGLVFIRKNLVQEWFSAILILTASFGLLLRSKYALGWKIFYGPGADLLIIEQILVVLLVLGLVLVIKMLAERKKLKEYYLLLWLIPLVFGLEVLLRSARYTYISGMHYLGFMLDQFRFIGVSVQKPFKLGIVNQDFPSVTAGALLRFDFSVIYGHRILWLVLYPLGFIAAAMIIWLALKRSSRRIQIIVLAILLVLYIFQVIYIITADPKLVISL